MWRRISDYSASIVGGVLGIGLLAVFANFGFNPITLPYVIAGYAWRTVGESVVAFAGGKTEPVWIVVELKLANGTPSQMSFNNPAVPDMTLAECETALPDAMPTLVSHIASIPQLADAKVVGARCVVSADDPIKPRD
jgi:hypothetical protein